MTKNKMNIVFKDYPDALTLCEFAEMLGISQKLASKLIHTGEIEAIKVGREYRIAKVNAIRYLLGEQVTGKYVLNETFEPKVLDYSRTLWYCWCYQRKTDLC